MCLSKEKSKDNTAVGRRVIPSLVSRELFQKVDFYKYMSESEK